MTMRIFTRHRLSLFCLCCILLLIPLDPYALGRWAGGGSQRVLILGIDGLEWDLLNRYFEEGRLPAIRRLVKRGASGRLKTVSRASPEIWTSIATGRLPEAHGIRGYTDTSDMRKVKAFWDILSEYGKRIILVNWWCTYPAEEIDGINISSNALRGNFARKLPHTIFPESRYDELSAIMLEKGDRRAPEFVMGSTLEKYWWEVDFERVARHLLAERWNLFAIYFHQIDFASHKWTAEVFDQKKGKFIKKASEEKAEELWKTIDFYYENMDRMVSDFLGSVGPDTLVILVSDHGWAYDGREHYHKPDGVIIVCGPDVKRGVEIEGASVLDVLPTVMYAMNLPVSRELAGKALTGIFTRAAEVRYIESYGALEKRVSSGLEVGEEYKRQLRAVGYIQ